MPLSMEMSKIAKSGIVAKKFTLKSKRIATINLSPLRKRKIMMKIAKKHRKKKSVKRLRSISK